MAGGVDRAHRRLARHAGVWAWLPIGLALWLVLVALNVLGVAGIGFTTSPFISGLAFRAGVLQAEAKLVIIVASLVAGAAGYLVLHGARAGAPEAEAAP